MVDFKKDEPQLVHVDWHDKPFEFPPDATDEDIDEALKTHPDNPDNPENNKGWKDALTNMGMFEANAIQQLPFGIGEKVIPKEDKETSLGTFKSVPGLEDWRKENPKQTMASDFLGGTVGYAPAAAGAEVLGGGMLANAGAGFVHDMANRAYQEGGMPDTQEAWDSAKNSLLGGAASKLIKNIPIPGLEHLSDMARDTGGSVLGALAGYGASRYTGGDPWTAAILGAMLGPHGRRSATLGHMVSDWPGMHSLINAMTQQGAKTVSAFSQNNKVPNGQKGQKDRASMDDQEQQ